MPFFADFPIPTERYWTPSRILAWSASLPTPALPADTPPPRKPDVATNLSLLLNQVATNSASLPPEAVHGLLTSVLRSLSHAAEMRNRELNLRLLMVLLTSLKGLCGTRPPTPANSDEANPACESGTTGTATAAAAAMAMAATAAKAAHLQHLQQQRANVASYAQKFAPQPAPACMPGMQSNSATSTPSNAPPTPAASPRQGIAQLDQGYAGQIPGINGVGCGVGVGVGPVRNQRQARRVDPLSRPM